MQDIHAQARTGIQFLIIRQVLLQAVTFGGGVILARTLDPAEFGLFTIVGFWIGILALFGDFGLAASFIQRKAELTDRDLQVGFTLQQIMFTVVGLIMLALSPLLTHLYTKAPTEMAWLLRVMIVSLFLSSWKAMSALQLERSLRYKSLAWVDVLETLIYQALAVGLAVAGLGVWSLVWASLARGIAGTTLLYYVAPWPVRLAFDRGIAKEILKFGVPFQIQTILNQVGSWVTPLLIANVIGPRAVGYLGWASSNGRKPQMVIDSIVRVSFPHFSRIQDDRPEMERILLRYVAYALVPTVLWVSLLVSVGPTLVSWIYSTKWVAAVGALQIYALSLLLDVFTWPIGTAANALGSVKRMTQAVLVRNVVSLGLSVPLTFVIGFKSVPLAYCIALALSAPLYFLALDLAMVARITRQLVWLLLPALVSVIAGLLVVRAPMALALRASVGSAAVCLAYSIGLWMVAPSWVMQPIASRLRHALV